MIGDSNSVDATSVEEGASSVNDGTEECRTTTRDGALHYTEEVYMLLHDSSSVNYCKVVDLINVCKALPGQ